jgi:hypothetical protein
VAEHGFGMEEWLFSDAFDKDGWRYGFVQGVNMCYSSQGLAGRDITLVFYTIEPDKSRRLVGQLACHVLDSRDADAAYTFFNREEPTGNGTTAQMAPQGASPAPGPDVVVQASDPPARLLTATAAQVAPRIASLTGPAGPPGQVPNTPRPPLHGTVGQMASDAAPFARASSSLAQITNPPGGPLGVFNVRYSPSKLELYFSSTGQSEDGDLPQVPRGDGILTKIWNQKHYHLMEADPAEIETLIRATQEHTRCQQPPRPTP